MSSLLVGIAAGVIAALFVGEIGGWLTRISINIVKFAARRLPEAHRRRFFEEWSAEVLSLRSSYAMFIFSTRLVFVARQLKDLFADDPPPTESEVVRREAGRFVSSRNTIRLVAIAVACGLLAPLLVVVFGSSRVTSDEIVLASTAATVLTSGFTFSYALLARRENGDSHELDDENRNLGSDAGE